MSATPKGGRDAAGAKREPQPSKPDAAGASPAKAPRPGASKAAAPKPTPRPQNAATGPKTGAQKKRKKKAPAKSQGTSQAATSSSSSSLSSTPVQAPRESAHEAPSKTVGGEAATEENSPAGKAAPTAGEKAATVGRKSAATRKTTEVPTPEPAKAPEPARAPAKTAPSERATPLERAAPSEKAATAGGVKAKADDGAIPEEAPQRDEAEAEASDEPAQPDEASARERAAKPAEREKPAATASPAHTTSSATAPAAPVTQPKVARPADSTAEDTTSAGGAPPTAEDAADDAAADDERAPVEKPHELEAQGEKDGSEPTSTASEPAEKQPRSKRRAGSLVAGLLALGLGFAAMTQVQQNEKSGLDALSQADLVALLSTVNDQSARLETELDGLRQSKAKLAQGGDAAAVADAQKRLDQMNVLNGTVGVSGPGITIRISGTNEGMTAANLLDAVQELRDAGAESIDVGGHRVIASTWFADVGSSPGIDGTALPPATTITAIGDPHTMSTAMAIPGGVTDTLTQAGAQVKVTEGTSLKITSVASHR